MDGVKTSILKSINTIINRQLRNLKYDKTFKSTIWKKNDDGTYQISYKSQLYNVFNTLETDLKLGQSVWVKIPCGVLRDMHICGINYKKKQSTKIKQEDVTNEI